MGVRVQLSRRRGARKPAGAVNIARPGPFGNPFHVTARFSAAMAVEAFRGWVAWSDDPRARWIREHLVDLEDRDVACWCALDRPCHGDVLLAMASAAPPREAAG